MARSGSALIGTLSHQAEAYGPGLIELGLRMLRGEAVPPYNYIETKLLAARNGRMHENPAARSVLPKPKRG